MNNLERIVNDLRDRKVVGQFSNSMIKVTFNGNGECEGVKINKKARTLDDAKLEEGVLTAIVDGLAKVQALVQQELMKELK